MSKFVLLERCSLVPARVEAPVRATYSLDAAAELTGVHPEMIRYFCRLGMFAPLAGDPEGGPIFDDDAIYELRRIEHYRRHFGVNRRALPLICRLLHDVERLEAEVRFRAHP